MSPRYFFVGVFVRVVAAGIRYDERSNDRTACAQPCEKEISDFVFEHGKGTASYDVYILKNINNNDVHIKYINHFFSNNLQTFLRSVRFPKSSVGSLSRRPFLST